MGEVGREFCEAVGFQKGKLHDKTRQELTVCLKAASVVLVVSTVLVMIKVVSVIFKGAASGLYFTVTS